VSSWESEGVNDHEGNEEQSQWSSPLFSPCPILTVDITGLVGNLKSCSPSMFQLYSILKSRHPEGRITLEEIDIASNKRRLTAEASAEFLGGLEAQAANIKSAFAKQQVQAMVC
jgi:hypothetical protein